MSQPHEAKPGHDHPTRSHPFASYGFLLLAAFAILSLAQLGIEHAATVADHHEAHRADVSQVSHDIMSAVRLGQTGNYLGAAQLLARIVQEHPNNVDAIFNLGVALSAAERYDDAEAAFMRIEELDPKDFNAVAEHAGVKKAQGDERAALSLLESIPAGEGNMKARLAEDPRWDSLKENPRMQALRKKHGVD
jgi:Flp pilus assembly protein TadD